MVLGGRRGIPRTGYPAPEEPTRVDERRLAAPRPRTQGLTRNTRRCESQTCGRHRVFAQTGTSKVRLPCTQVPFIPYIELLERLRAADVVITHAGNTVRLVQRAGKVPIAIARTAAAREMPNDHQVAYLRHEERTGRVVAVWDTTDLGAAVDAHPAAELTLLAQRPLPERVGGDQTARGERSLEGRGGQPVRAPSPAALRLRVERTLHQARPPPRRRLR
jgi:UDP-N-acetylglucosamine transferase subunit ALG13